MVRTVAALVAISLMPVMLGITVTRPGTVTTVVSSRLFTQPSGDQHLHGIVKDPISGDIYVGDWNALSVGDTPWFGPYVENYDSIRRINALKEVSIISYVVSPNALAYSKPDREIYLVLGSASCHGEAARSAGPTLNGVVALNPATGTTRVLSGAKPGTANGTPDQARFSGPVGIASDPASGALFVSEACQNRIREVGPSGDAATLAGSGTAGNTDGVALDATFNDPHGLAYCAHEHLLYVADTGNNEIRTVDLDAKVSTLAGSPKAGFVDGSGPAARFDHPTGVACDDAGNVYVADSLNNSIREISSFGVVSTVAGNGAAGTLDGVGSAARFSTPGDIMFDSSEHTLYVVDWASNTIRKIALGVAGGKP
jgi:NHL repeat